MRRVSPRSPARARGRAARRWRLRGPALAVAALAALAVVAALGVAAWRLGLVGRLAAASGGVKVVRSAVSVRGDSLEVVVRWALGARLPVGADSVQVAVGIDSADTAHAATLPATRVADTAHFALPPRGGPIRGSSCVAGRRDGRILPALCTPWQFVRPGAEPSSAAVIVIRPEGLQVDPDPDGRCARWQRRHPERSPWVETNRVAVPECTGPNGRPTAAQFCAFAVLPDGRRVPTTNSARVPYCDTLFRAWLRERRS